MRMDHHGRLTENTDTKNLVLSGMMESNTTIINSEINFSEG